MGSFYCEKINGPENAVILGCRSGSGDVLEARISLRYGANLCRYSFNGQAIIDYEPELLENHDFTGTPVLYPTPNRVEDGVFTYRGRSYHQVKRQHRVFEHGLVFDEPWDIEKLYTEEDRVVLIVKIDWNKKSPLYNAFPFEHSIQILYELYEKEIAISYSISNHGPVEIPYGFGLHPYFQKLSGDMGTRIKIPVSHLMDATDKLLPTGKIISIEETGFNLNIIGPIGKYDLDHVFIRTPNNEPAVIQYSRQRFEVSITASADFSYFVVYSPKGAPYFCIESQTCSTNAHNLYNDGFRQESGLKFILPGEEAKGTVNYSIRPLIS